MSRCPAVLLTTTALGFALTLSTGFARAPQGPPGPVPQAAALTALRIDPAHGRTDLSIVASGASFRVLPPLVEQGHVRLFVDLPGGHVALADRSFPGLRNGSVLALRVEEDRLGARVTIYLPPHPHFRVLPGPNGLLVRIDDVGSPARTWAVSAPGSGPAPRVQAPPEVSGPVPAAAPAA
jgi:hypothetical protein